MEQLNLFDENDMPESFFEQEWKGMPEFNMNPEVPILTIKVSFKTKEDVEKFAQLVDQKIYFNRENYWFPKLNRNAFSDLVYIDKNDES